MPEVHWSALQWKGPMRLPTDLLPGKLLRGLNKEKYKVKRVGICDEPQQRLEDPASCGNQDVCLVRSSKTRLGSAVVLTA